MNCQNCGAPIPAGVAQCSRCGASIAQAPAPPQAIPSFGGGQIQVIVNTGAVPGAPGVPTLVPSEPMKSKVTAGVLGIFLGALGVHRFYLGYTGIGLAQLLITIVAGPMTCGAAAAVSGIWGLVEGILILTGSINQDAQGRPLKG